MTVIVLPKFRKAAPEKLTALSRSIKSVKAKSASNVEFSSIVCKPLGDIIVLFIKKRDHVDLTVLDRIRLAYILTCSITRPVALYERIIAKSLEDRIFVDNVIIESVYNGHYHFFIYVLVLSHETRSSIWNHFIKVLKEKDEFTKNRKFKHLAGWPENSRKVCGEIAADAISSKKPFKEVWKIYFHFGMPRENEKLVKLADEMMFVEVFKELGKARKEKDVRYYIEQALHVNNDGDVDTFSERFSRILLLSIDNIFIQKPLCELSRKILGSPPEWGRFPKIGLVTREQYEKISGLLKFRYFEIVANIIFDNLHLDEFEKKRLNSRTVFWTNYRNSIKEIKIYLPSVEYELVKRNREGYSKDDYYITDELMNQIGITSERVPICILKMKNVTIVEFFRGKTHSLVLVDENDIKHDEKVLDGDMMDEYRDAAQYRINHDIEWMLHLPDFLNKKYNVHPDDWNNIKLPRDYMTMGFNKEFVKSYRKMIERHDQSEVLKESTYERTIISNERW